VAGGSNPPTANLKTADHVDCRLINGLRIGLITLRSEVPIVIIRCCLTCAAKSGRQVVTAFLNSLSSLALRFNELYTCQR